MVMHDRWDVKHDYDNLPDSFLIHIDRARLTLYLRLKSLVAWVFFCGFWGAIFGFSSVTQEANTGKFHTLKVLFTTIATHTGGGIAIGAGIGLLFYLGASHWQSASYAKSIAMSVEGPFLRLQTGCFIRKDRKIHFRSIHDYSVIDNWFARRLGIQVLRMSITGGGQYPFISVAGVKDCLKVRDLLAEVDAKRENG